MSSRKSSKSHIADVNSRVVIVGPWVDSVSYICLCIVIPAGRVIIHYRMIISTRLFLAFDTLSAVFTRGLASP